MVATAGGRFDTAHRQELLDRLRHPPDPEPAEDEPARPRTGWTLRQTQSTFPWLAGYSLSGTWRLLRRWGMRLRRGRPQQFSPDPTYRAKEAQLHAALARAGQAPGQEVLLFGDEFTYYHWPLVGRDWMLRAGPPPCAARAAPGERRHRVVAAVDAMSGQVHYRQRSRMGREQFIPFLRQLDAAYPAAEQITLVLDNWPVHHQVAVRETVANLPRLELLFLPTYAPWLNPIEKLWDWLKAAVLRQHHLVGHWPLLRAQVAAFLDSFAAGSSTLLHRVGLLGTGRLATALHAHTTDLGGQT